MTQQQEIIDLSVKWTKDIGGMSVIVPIGAAMNILKTVSKHAPQEVRAALADFLQMMAKDLTGEKH